MATQKALYTNIEDFRDYGAGFGGFVVNPYLYHNAEDYSVHSSFRWYGAAPLAADFTQGVRSKAVKIGRARSMYWLNSGVPASQSKYMISVWVKPSAVDCTPTANGGQMFTTIATNRGDGWGDRGLHLAINNDPTYGAILNVRVYGYNGTVNMYSDGVTAGTTLFTLVPDEWVHLVVKYDSTAIYPVTVFANGQRIIYTSTDTGTNISLRPIAVGSISFSCTFTVGDTVGTAGVKLDGNVDEALYLAGANVWDDASILTYYEGILNPTFYDWRTTPGSIQLAKKSTGIYSSAVASWVSPTVDLGTGFDDYGRVQVNGTFPGVTATRIYTRTSDNGTVWGAWAEINQTGTLNSANKRFLQVKVEMSTTLGTSTPVVDEIQILDYAKKVAYSLKAEPLLIYKDLATGLESMGEVKNAYDIIINEEINGEDTLTFKIPLNDPKRGELGSEPVELIAAIADRQYVIKEARDNREDDGRLYTEFVGEAYWYELRDFKVKALELVSVSAYDALTATLTASIIPTGWTIGRVEPLYPDRRRDVKEEWKSVLEVLRTITETWGGELVLDVPNKTINLLATSGYDNGVRFYYNKNLTKINRTVDTYDLVTRLYVYGKGNLDITTVNGGLDYIENLEWVNLLGLRNKVRASVWKDQSYSIPQNLLEDGQVILADSSKPRIAYVISVQDLSSLSGHEHEAFALGDTVYTVDKALLTTEAKFQVKSRIVRRKYNVREPWKTVVELNQPKRLLSDAQERAFDSQLQTLAETNPLDAMDATQMTVFNALLNSRAEEGTTIYWNYEGDGFGYTQENAGFSGAWSFKVTGEYGKKNILRQRVFGVSHRTAYTVSAMVAKEGTITRGGTLAEPFVGMKVVVYYKPDALNPLGSQQEFPLGVADTTTGGLA